ncbi:Aste57867_14840 [Aphanomyces stellatus]|uniref:Nicastrin n=1 Tax=Aphanomyces stellatus TaxID=120398 RepID=A0A485L299_9STRA|nr:hypothetical protein As57867_014784 [Aphanomyces stellatus]VFT91658.1 Aste57867_14840 [Aphanomyces stellatus]
MVKVSGASAALAVGSFFIACLGGVDAGAVTTGAPANPNIPGGECVRMFHSKGDVGCYTLNKDAARARLVSITTATEFTQTTLKEDSILIVPDTLFTTENLARLNADLVKGLLIYPTSTSPTFNYESTNPQGKGTVDGVLNPNFGSYAWNPQGRSIMASSLPYPVLEVESEAKAKTLLLDLAHKNQDTPVGSTFGVVYKGAMEYYFGPAKMDSRACLGFKNIYGNRSPKCLPVGGQSAWGVKGDLSSEKPMVVAMAPMDTNAFSHVYAPGGNAGASGLVALLAAADALKSVPSMSLKKNILFAAFQGESYGFVGSRRFLSDLKLKCANPVAAATPFGSSFCASPIKSSLAFTGVSLSNIDTAIAVDQVGVSADNMYLHVNKAASSTEALVTAITKAPSAKGRVKTSSVDGIPPGPLISFLNDQEYGNSSLASVVLSGYDTAFPNAYHSRYDVNTTVTAANVVQAAQVLAEALFASAAAPGTDIPASVQVNATLVANLLACITSDWTCATMAAYSKTAVASMNDYLQFTDDTVPSFMQPVTLYSSVYSDNRMPTIRVNKSAVVADLPGQTWQDSFKLNLYPNAYETFTRAFLATAVSDVDAQPKPCAKTKDCADSGSECVYPGVCVRRSAFFHDAFSPGLKREATYGLYTILNESMPLWTEPNWNTLGTYVFPDPGNTIGYVTLGAGAASLAIGYLLAGRFLGHFRKQKLL